MGEPKNDTGTGGTVNLNCDIGGVCCVFVDGRPDDKISESWRNAWSCAVPM
jgi:hypothetical protein